jgi:GT2 family glycosyltransferase
MIEKVAVGFAYRTMSPSEFAVRLIRLWAEMSEVQRGGLIYVPYRHWLYEARNEMVRDFLSTEAEALLMVDTDMIFEPDDLRRLMSIDAPIAAGAYMFNLEQLDAAMNIPDIGPTSLLADPLPDEPGEVDFAGTGFMLIKREVFEAIGEKWFNHLTIDAPAAEGEDHEGWWLWEDWSFCERARNAGYKIMLDPRTRLGHVKSLTLTPGRDLEQA